MHTIAYTPFAQTKPVDMRTINDVCKFMPNVNVFLCVLSDLTNNQQHRLNWYQSVLQQIRLEENSKRFRETENNQHPILI